MKHIIYTLSLLLFISCDGKPKQEKTIQEIENELEELYTVYPYQYSSSDSIDFKVELYTVKEKLYTLLDSIIILKDKCPQEVRYKDEFIFESFTFENDSSHYVSIGYLDTNNFDYSWCSGIFFYRNYRFNYLGKFLDDYFEKKDMMVLYRIVDPEKIMIDIDDTGLYWRYVLTPSELKTISYKNCEGWWSDGRNIWGGPVIYD